MRVHLSSETPPQAKQKQKRDVERENMCVRMITYQIT